MSKAAVHNISRNLAREWATQGIRVNTLVPGFFPAEQNRKVLTPERVAQIMGHTPMKRFGNPEELGGATLLLASNAGSFITGQEIIVRITSYNVCYTKLLRTVLLFDFVSDLHKSSVK